MTVASMAVPTLLTLSLVIPPGPANAQNSALQTRDPDVLRIAGLQGAAQQKELRQLLLHLPRNAYRVHESVFYHEAQLRSAPRALVQDVKVGTQAAQFLSLIGEPDDLRFIVQHPPPSKHQAFPNRWAYGVASSLLDPTMEEDWVFLRDSALNKYEDGWVEVGAIQTLKLIASSRSRELLEETQAQNQSRASAAAKALEYIRSRPSPLTGTNLVELADRTAQAVKSGNWERNGEPRYNAGNDKALVTFEFTSGRDLLFYTATFWRTQNIWKLHGVRETGQALVASTTY